MMSLFYAGRQPISIDDLVSRMLDILSEEHRRKAFGLTVANVLMKDMLLSYHCQLVLVPHTIGELCLSYTLRNIDIGVVH